jgi:hypothetical protein
MTVYPGQVDNDKTIVRIDDNLSEFGTMSINQLREAVFAIEKTIGLNPQGSKTSLGSRIAVSINADGTINSEALSSVGLVTLPIYDAQIANNAGIKEFKLDLDYSTADLNTSLTDLDGQVEIITDLAIETKSDLLIHISGGETLTDNTTLARHVVSQIDLNNIPTDIRDTYTWTGLLDKDGNIRSATQLADALLAINNELVDHQNLITYAHPATAITVDATNFLSLPSDLENVQEALDCIDTRETISTGIDRAILNSNGIPRTARAQDLNLDGYNINLIPPTRIEAYLAEPSQLAPRDNITIGDDIIKFLPEDNSDFSFDAKFAHVKIGDIVRINYGNGLESIFPIKSIRFIPGADWTVRIDTYNLVSQIGDGYARIDRARFDHQTWGVYAAAGVLPDIIPDGMYFTQSVILGNPRGAAVVGLGFDPNKIDLNHYNLWLRLYVNGDPEHSYYDLPPIDITGNFGSTPGKYNLDRIVEETNKQFRRAGYNYRFIAFAQNGEFGLMLADHYNGAAFTIISGQRSGAVLTAGSYEYNVIADSTDGYDALGLGGTRAGFASPVGSYDTAMAAGNYPTLVIPPIRDRNSIINGSRRDLLAKPNLTQGDGYWNATITNVVTDVVYNTTSVEYTILLDLTAEELMVGKTIVVQPTDNLNNTIPDYGRFIISGVAYETPCGGSCKTIISVINGVHGLGDPVGAISGIGTEVKVYFSDDSVPFNMTNLAGSMNDYHRYHEIFVNEIGESFSVERARMIKQSLSGFNLDTMGDSWRIRQVSSKFVGERASTGNDFRYFTRFVVTDYNQITGEFDGYLGDPVGNGTINNGPLTRGRKDFPVRFYDNTYVNFIDIEFRENANSPGSILLPIDSISRYVDIEIFPSLRNHNEYLTVAGVSHDSMTYQSITDLREFGTLSEENFTDSAIQFIESGERYLHTNGIVRGFEYEQTGITQSVLEFTGGMALVNGSFVAMDSFDVKLPEIYTTLTSVLEFFICVTETGQLKAIIKDNGSQFFTADYEYFVETLTFAEIVDKRKDLTIIARVKAQVANSLGTITYNLLEVTDARRFVYNQDISTFSFSMAESEDGYNSSFKTPDSLMNWVNEYGVNEVQVQYVKIDSPTTLSFTKEVNLIGGTYDVQIVEGLIFASGNWKIKNAKVFYTLEDPWYTHISNIFNVELSRAAIAISSVISMENFGIENTTFYYSGIQRPPFIGIYSPNATFKNGKFFGNTFIDEGTSTYCLAIAFANTDPTSLTSPTFSNIIISENIAINNQGLLISASSVQENGTAGEWLSVNKVNIDNIKITNNKFGYICYLTDGGKLLIENNISEVILDGITATMHTENLTYGLSITDTHGYSTEHIIQGNTCSYLKAETTAGVDQLKTIISKNIITRRSDILIDKFIPLYDDINNKRAITTVSNSFDVSNVICSDNIIDGLVNGYLYNIYTEGGVTISGNIINNISTNGYGIFNFGFHPDQPSTIIGNTLHKRDETNISYFIFANTDASVYGNNMSHFILSNELYDGYDGYDGYAYGSSYFTNLNVIRSSIWNPLNSSFAHNINQVSECSATVFPVSSLLFNETPTPASDPNISAVGNERISLYCRTPNTGLARIENTDSIIWTWDGSGATNDGTVGIVIPVYSLIPKHTSLLSFDITVTVVGDWVVTGSTLEGQIANNAYPELVLEINNRKVLGYNISTDGNFRLTYRNGALYTGERPNEPLNNTATIRIKQGTTEDILKPGCYIGPTGAGSLTMLKPTLKYLY